MEYAIEKPPTARQLELVDAIREFLAENGFPPTFRSLMDRMGIKSPNGIRCHFIAAQRKGLIRRVQCGTAVRYMPVVPEGCCPCCSQPIPN